MSKDKDFSVCEASPTGEHRMDLATVQIGDHDDECVWIDVNCMFCGQSGCIIQISEDTDVAWA